MCSFKMITAELDEIADQLQNSGQKRLARQLDIVSNSLAKRQAAFDSLGFPKGTPSSEPPPGSGDADEAGHDDAFEAKHYHKVPIGQKSVSDIVIGKGGLASILDRLDFAEEGEINIQKRGSSRRANEVSDTFTTSGLPDSGDEEEVPPPDLSQEGGTLQFYGTEPPGDLHMPGGEGKELSDEVLASRARKILKRKVAEVIVEEPKDLHISEEGEDVERDQDLGGLGGGKESDLPVVQEDEVIDEVQEDEVQEDELEEESEEESGALACMEYANRGASILGKRKVK